MFLENALSPVALVFDPNSITLGLYQLILQNQGFTVFQAEDTDTALQQAISVKPDLILLDLQLPGLESFALCMLLKAATDTCRIPVIFISGADDPTLVKQAYRLGAVDFIVKPCRMHHLVARLRAHLLL